MKKNLLLLVCLFLVITFNYTTSFAQVTLPYQQKFNLQNFPPFWMQTSTISPRWSVSTTANAGGTPNEMMASGTAGIGVSRLIVGPINTIGLTSLNLQFDQIMSCTDTANYSLSIQSSVNGTVWTNEGFTLDENSFNCSNTINITINNNVGSITYLAWSIIGNHSYIDNWYIDDIIISQVYANDVGISILQLPDVMIIPNQPLDKFGDPTWYVVARNYGTIPQSFSVLMEIMDTATVLTDTAIVSILAPGSHVIVENDHHYLPPAGSYTMNICIQLQGDQNPINDCKSKEFIFDYGDFLRVESTVNVNNGWNLVSVAGVYDWAIRDVDSWWPGRDMLADVYKFDGSSYKSVTTVHPGTGYWMLNSGDQTYNTGDEWPEQGIITYFHYPITVNKGWNLIGGFERPFPSEKIISIPPDIISAPIYGFSSGYHVADTLISGYGYWVNTSATGLLMIDTSCVLNSPQSVYKKKDKNALFKEDWGRIILTDATGNSFTLYAVSTQEDLSKYELPPVPPAGIFDIRYSSGRIVENLNTSQAIEMNVVAYPVTIRVENMGIKLMDVHIQELNKELHPGEELIIHNNLINKLNVQSSHFNTPVVYALDQNYPNPFNPITKIKYSIAKQVNVTLKVFDILGNEIVTLINEEKPTGTFEIKFDATKVSSGVYFYQLRAGSFVQTRKMILLK